MNENENIKAAFMGRITAGVTHEMKNVLAIIKESAGLMQDILELNKDSLGPQRDKLARVASNILQQVERGVNLSQSLNRFAHSPDETYAEVDLNSVVEEVVFLTQRFARLKGVVLAPKSQPSAVILKTDPLKIQMIFTSAVDMLLGVLTPGSALSLEPADRGGGSVAIYFASETKDASSGTATPESLASLPAWESLSEAAVSVNAELQIGAYPVWFSMNFS